VRCLRKPRKPARFIAIFSNDLYSHSTNSRYILSEVSPDFPKEVYDQAPYDFIYSFDVFVHVDIHTFYHTLLSLQKIVTPESHIFMSVANLCSENGWTRFSKQKVFKVAGFYCKLI
jgi:2-polyprenyl-3-methyl-5-hydroxy-6-metoxy-1,4-benzoquinol methylase